jgi:hypothetical protein
VGQQPRNRVLIRFTPHKSDAEALAAQPMFRRELKPPALPEGRPAFAPAGTPRPKPKLPHACRNDQGECDHFNEAIGGVFTCDLLTEILPCSRGRGDKPCPSPRLYTLAILKNEWPVGCPMRAVDDGSADKP